MTLDEQIARTIAMLPKERKRFIVVPKKPRPKGGKARHAAKGTGPGLRGGHGKRVEWRESRFGWDALLLDSRGHSLNAINYGLPNAPTAAQKRTAERLLLKPVGGKKRHGLGMGDSMKWVHEGPFGVDRVEWWTLPGHPVGVTRSLRKMYTVAYVATGEVAGTSSAYQRFKTLAEAKKVAARTDAPNSFGSGGGKKRHAKPHRKAKR